MEGIDGYRFANEDTMKFMRRDYLLPEQTLDQRVTEIGDTVERILGKPGFSAKFKEYMKKGWISLSTPMWTNFGTSRGLSISCFGSYITDDIDSIFDTVSEVGKMSKLGGGTSAYFGNLRPRGAKITNNGSSSGSVHFMQLFENVTNIISQGSTRRGSFAAYLPVEHPDLGEFLTIRDDGSPLRDISFAVTIPDKWMEDMVAGDADKRSVWAKIIESRIYKGYPYIMFHDTVNNKKPDVYVDKELVITHSNLCSEILLPTNPNESFVCNLSSLNLLHYDEWRDSDVVEVVVQLLDASMTEFVEKARKIKFMERAANFAERHRALGIGVLGWHSYLQSKMIPFESKEAFEETEEIFSIIAQRAEAESCRMAEEYGEPELLKGYGRRHSTLMAIAPTKSSSFILGQVSEGIEPIHSNYFVKDTAKGKYTLRNLQLEKLLEDKGKNSEDVWKSIMQNSGSVQHLDFLSDEEKAVFLTFRELDQEIIIDQAALRQKYIDQTQSLNVIFPTGTPAKKISDIYISAWRKGIKTLYYQLGTSAAQEFSKSLKSSSRDVVADECAACSL